MKTVSLLAISFILSLPACVSRAPSTYELHKRTGVPSPDDVSEKFPSASLRSTSSVSMEPMMPARVAPVVERVWLFDRKIGNYWQQGTWVWLEVEQGRWLHEVDPGGAPLVTPVMKTNANRYPVAPLDVEASQPTERTYRTKF